MSNEYDIWLHEKRGLSNKKKRELLEIHRSPSAVFEGQCLILIVFKSEVETDRDNFLD